MSKSIILIADGDGKLLFYNYESSEILYEWVPYENKIIYGLHITNDLYSETNKEFYTFLYVIFKDGTIEFYLLSINGEIKFDKGLKKLLSLQSPINMMMQVPKFEVLFYEELLELTSIDCNELTESKIYNRVSFLFEQIKNLDNWIRIKH